MLCFNGKILVIEEKKDVRLRNKQDLKNFVKDDFNLALIHTSNFVTTKIKQNVRTFRDVHLTLV